jgi:hypothetical protein
MKNLYHISIDGQIITSEPISLEIIFQLYGNTQLLEKQGFRLILVKGGN